MVLILLTQNYSRRKSLAIPKSVLMKLRVKIYTFGYGTGLGLSLILHQIKNAMTSEEQNKIERCRIMIVGKGDFADAINTALLKAGFCNIIHMEAPTEAADIAVDLAINGISARLDGKLPVVYPFDFIEGGAAMVVLPEDKPALEAKGDVRLCAAKYMSGYCAFWNMDNSDWLRAVLPRIEQGEQSAKAQRTAACICARILANIAAGRDVKHFPRFYLSKILE